MHHVERGALDILGEANHPVEGELLRQRIVHLGHVLEADAVLAHQLLVHEHDDVVVLGMDAGDAARCRHDLQRLPDVAVRHHAAEVPRPDVGREDLYAGMAVLHRIGELAEMRHRHLAHQREMEAVVAVAGVSPLRLGRFDRLLDGAVVHALHEIDQRRGAAMQGGLADLRRRIGQHVGPSRRAHRHQAMDVRVDAAGNDQTVLGRHGARRFRQRARPADQHDASVLHADIGSLGSRRQHAGAAGDGEVEHQVTPAGGARHAGSPSAKRRRISSGSRSRTMKTSRLAWSESGQRSSQRGG